MTLSALGIFSAAGAGGVAAGTYELISTTILGSSQPSITFDVSTLGSTYRHLQIRATGRSTHAANAVGIRIRFNGVSTSSYSTHGLYGSGSAVASFSAISTESGYAGLVSGANAATNNFGATVLDILDPFSSTKNKTTRSLHGVATGEVGVHSAAFLSTAPATSITLLSDAGNFIAGSRFSLYGIKG
jgi:hypothetical protein